MGKEVCQCYIGVLKWITALVKGSFLSENQYSEKDIQILYTVATALG